MRSINMYDKCDLVDDMRQAIDNKVTLGHEQIKGLLFTVMVMKFTLCPIEMVFKGRKSITKYIMTEMEKLDTVAGATMVVNKLDKEEFTFKHLVFWISFCVKRYTDEVYNREGVRPEVTIGGLLRECDKDFDGNFILGLNLMAVKELMIKGILSIFCGCVTYLLVTTLFEMWSR